MSPPRAGTAVLQQTPETLSSYAFSGLTKKRNKEKKERKEKRIENIKDSLPIWVHAGKECGEKKKTGNVKRDKNKFLLDLEAHARGDGVILLFVYHEFIDTHIYDFRQKYAT